MNIEDLGSDSDSSDDCDYRPENDSGSESIDEKDELNGSNEGTTKPVTKKRRKVRKTRSKQVDDENEEEEREITKTALDPEKEKQRVEALWADFLSGTEIPLEKSSTKIETKSTTSKTDIPKLQKSNPAPTPKIFEFAGETIEVSENHTENSSTSTNPVKPTQGPTSSLGIKRPSTGGLSSVLNQFSKKNKLSVLEKTKLDWDGFKSKEGIKEELKTHNRGRDG